MKRIWLHVLFWISYLAEDTLLAYWWDGARFNGKIVLSLQLCATLLPPKILFTYFVLYVILDRILKQNNRLFLNIASLMLAAVITLLLLRTIDIYFIYPVIFGIHTNITFFKPFSFLFNLIDLGFVSGLAIAMRQVRLQLASREREKLLIKEKLEAELKFLKNQTNPHFLFNTLNNIYALARKKSDSTAGVVMKLSKILRFMLYESGKKFITIGEEIRLIEDYIDLEKIRYNENLHVIFDTDIDNDAQQVSRLLLLPFVENAFKHGVSESFFDSTVKIAISLQQGKLLFEIENTKEEEEGKQQSDSKIGLLNIKRQLELMYPGHSLVVDNQPKKFKVTLNVNLDKHEEI